MVVKNSIILWVLRLFSSHVLDGRYIYIYIYIIIYIYIYIYIERERER